MSDTLKKLKEAAFQLAFIKSKLEKLRELAGKEHPAMRNEIDKILKEL